MHKIVVFSKEGCHLCENAIEILKELQKDGKFELEVVDIRTDESLHREYFLKIPVVRLDERKVFEVEDIALQKEAKVKLEHLVSSLKD